MSGFTDFQSIMVLALFISLCWSSYVDFKKFILPDFLTLIAFLLGITVALADPLYVTIQNGLIGAAAGYAGSWALRWAVFHIKKQEALGLGDVKLFGAAGMWVGAEGVISVAFYGALLTLLGVLIKAAIKRQFSLNQIVPFGPGIAAGLMITLLIGPLPALLNLLLS